MYSKLNKVLSLPYSLYVCLSILPFKQAIRLPILINYKVKFKGIKKGSIIINSIVKRFMIQIGFSGSESIQSGKSIIILGGNSKIIFDGIAHFGEGIRIVVKNGNLKFGNNFYCNKNCFISSDNNMVLGNDVLLGWNVNIRDTDGHKILDNNLKSQKKRKYENVLIGNHCWICSYTDILKGTILGDDCVVGYRSCCVGTKAKNNSLLGGYPAKIIKEDINWIK